MVKKPTVEIIVIKGKDSIFVFRFCCSELGKWLFNNGDNKSGSDIAANQCQREKKFFLKRNKLPRLK